MTESRAQDKRQDEPGRPKHQERILGFWSVVSRMLAVSGLNGILVVFCFNSGLPGWSTDLRVLVSIVVSMLRSEADGIPRLPIV